jgi:hypothetical protein
MKKKSHKYAHLPVKQPEWIPWHTLCIDTIGPYKIGYGKNEVSLQCLTMIDPATGWFEIVDIPNKRADEVVQLLEFTWLSRYPWPTEVVMDKGSKFMAEVRDTLENQYGIKRKVISTRNPQANAMVERIHQVVGGMLDAQEIKDARDLDATYQWQGILAAIRRAVNASLHSTNKATPSQLVFGRDAILNVSFEANWQYLKERKQKLILHNNQRENSKRIPHTYAVNDMVMIKQGRTRKHGNTKYEGPFRIVQVNDNGTVKLVKDANDGGAVYETWNIRNLHPCRA